jgi:exonuclease SbcC
MIPIRLALRNFMPYRDRVPPLYFDSIHTACIAGDNGNGKSALIDAMTWALWGKTRAKSDDDLIHQGQSETEVEFDFAVGGQAYRIIRKHSRPKRRAASGKTLLEFQIAAGGGFRSISADSVSQTQQKIIDTLHMDYTTFINSAFLRQGHADEFTNQPPNKRKEVLGNILGLAVYDRLEEAAKDRARQHEMEKERLDRSIEEIAQELAKKPAYEAEVAGAEKGLAEAEEALKQHQARLDGLRQQKEMLESQRLQLSQLEEHINTTKREYERREQELREHRARIIGYEELIARRPSIEEGYAQLAEARALYGELEQKFRQSVALDKHKAQLEMAIERAQAELITEHKLAQSQIGQLEAEAARLPQLKNELKQAEAGLNELAGQETEIGRKRQAAQELRKQLNYLESGQGRLEKEINEIEEKLEMLAHQEGATCPLCKTELTSQGLERIKDQYTADKKAKAESLKSGQAELAAKKAELEALEGEIAPLEAQINQQKASLQGRVSLLKQGISEAQAVASQLAQARESLNEIEQRLANKDFAAGEQEALGRVEEETAKLDYDSGQHERVRQRLGELEQYQSPRRQLEEADRLLSQEKEAAQKAEEASHELKQRLEADQGKSLELKEALEALPQLAADLTGAEAEHRALDARQKQAQELAWQARAKLERCTELEARQKETVRLIAQASREESIYRELAQAFGKKGIQALLIEMALPEIEAEANRLLGKMTDNRMHVKIETQRETKKGEVQETLDIKIADELGTRNYEMFSGGEAFRINFAVRIALSKLLARRAGAPLPTLIIDEGFGTQDVAGIEKVKEAINSIQDDFEKILVITHMEEMRDAFPNRIDVIKTADGSTIEVN